VCVCSFSGARIHLRMYACIYICGMYVVCMWYVCGMYVVCMWYVCGILILIFWSMYASRYVCMHQGMHVSGSSVSVCSNYAVSGATMHLPFCLCFVCLYYIGMHVLVMCVCVVCVYVWSVPGKAPRAQEERRAVR
jgi:hypothetical protein